MKEKPHDFRVEELPAYAPSGTGEHLYIHFEKTNWNTADVVRRVAQAIGAHPKDASWAGLKDKHAVTTQWMSVLCKQTPTAESIEIPGVRILEITRHGNKLRTGHLRGNRFEILLRDVPNDRAQEVETVANDLCKTGAPNYFGPQRFGPEGRNLELAKSWLLRGGSAPRSPVEKKFLVSVLQAWLFNEALAARIHDGLFEHAVDGDVLCKEDTGGMFTTEDLPDAERRVADWSVSPTGPIFGCRMRAPEREAKKREDDILRAAEVTQESIDAFARYGEGTRRVYRVRPTNFAFRVTEEGWHLGFDLEKGAYATTILREILHREPEVD